jgi:putative ABC transport system permease protein
MIYNYLKIAFRNLRRHWGYTTINVLGLSVGLVVSFLIALWVRNEWSINKFFNDSERIYLLYANIDIQEGGVQTWNTTPYPLIAYTQENYSEVEVVGAYDPTNKKQLVYQQNQFLEDGIYATPGFFEVLEFPFILGDAASPFVGQESVAISERLAVKVFGENWQKEVLGATVKIDETAGYTVSAVFADPPQTSALQFDFVLSLDEAHRQNNDTTPWGNFDSRILIKTHEHTDIRALCTRFDEALTKNNPYAKGVSFQLHHYSDSYLYNRFENGKMSGGRIEYVQLFSGAALFLLIIACINFMNLATARASRRAREVGVRKTVGAGKKDLIIQFLLEAMLITGVSLLLAVGLSRLLLPYFQEITGKALTLDFTNLSFWGMLLSIGLLTSLLAGLYPAFFLSSFNIIHVLKKGRHSTGEGGSKLRKGLVVFQFILSAFLVIGALAVKEQVQYIKNKNLGLDKENVFYFRLPPKAYDEQWSFREELMRIPGVTNITFSSSNPLSVGAQTGDPEWEGMAPGENRQFTVLSTDKYFMEAMNIEMIAGEGFDTQLLNDTVSYIINETAAEQMKLEDPIGKKMTFWGDGGPIVGIAKNFHISSLYEAIGPLIIACNPNRVDIAMLRIEEERTQDVILDVEQTFNRFSAGMPFRYDFLVDRYNQMYQSEQRTSLLATWFALIALLVSSLGLLGLSSFMAEQRTREIGIRKILGASVRNIILMLSRDFLKLVVLALVISMPIGWIVINRWLDKFAYRIELTWWIFALTTLVAIGVTILTISYQSIRAALANPVNSLRQE